MTAHTTRANAKWFAGPANAALRKGETFAKSVKNDLDGFYSNYFPDCLL